MANRSRPLSPHLQVYKWQGQMVTSILNRATGIALSLGMALVVWGLLALAAGPDDWATFTRFARSPLGFIVLFGMSWSMAFHLLGGLRHLVQDLGHQYRIDEFVRNSWLSVIGSLVLTALLWVAAMSQWSQA